eukprot:scaffold23145_cov101-Isochrysis_galbana.AAC.2
MISLPVRPFVRSAAARGGPGAVSEPADLWRKRLLCADRDVRRETAQPLKMRRALSFGRRKPGQPVAASDADALAGGAPSGDSLPERGASGMRQAKPATVDVPFAHPTSSAEQLPPRPSSLPGLARRTLSFAKRGRTNPAAPAAAPVAAPDSGGGLAGIRRTLSWQRARGSNRPSAAPGA